MRGNTEAVRAILENSGDALLSEYNEWGDTPLHSAIKYDQYDIAKALLDKGAKVDLVNDEKQTVLHFAAKTGNSEIIDLLFARGDLEILNTRDKEGNTPLHLAVQEERNLTVNRLLDKHADADIRNARRETPLDIAIRTRKFRITWLLQIYQGSDAVML
jgi:ankyrin repeat protein